MITCLEISSALYSSVYMYSTLFICLVMAYYIMTTKESIIYKNNTFTILTTCIYAALLVLFIGFRPIGIEMGDTSMYIHSFLHREGYSAFSLNDEWLWNNFNIYCRDNGLSSTGFFAITAAFYIGGMVFLCWKIMRNNSLIGFLFCVASFSFFGYGINGIRNGLACSVILIAFAFFIESKKYKYIIGIILLFIAFGIHRSSLMPSICLLLSISIIKKTDVAIYIWLTSIIVSLLMGNIVGDFMASTGLFEEKMDYFYDIEQSAEAYKFTQTGFRFDFLIYSSIPVLMTWYITIKRNFNDKTFNVLANTYILTNAFWIMVIRASYSNRFAYLSWFIYPFIIAYPLLRMNLWNKDQNHYLALILISYVGFTFVLFLLGK